MKRPEFRYLLKGKPGIESHYPCATKQDVDNFLKSTAHIPGDTLFDPACNLSGKTLAAFRLFWEQWYSKEPNDLVVKPMLLYALEVLPKPERPGEVKKVGKCVKLLMENLDDPQGTDRENDLSQPE